MIPNEIILLTIFIKSVIENKEAAFDFSIYKFKKWPKKKRTIEQKID